MADRGIRHQPLDVGLPDRGERAEDHRGDRHQDDQQLPRAQQVAERRRHHPQQQRHRRDLGAVAKNTVTEVGAPS